MDKMLYLFMWSMIQLKHPNFDMNERGRIFRDLIL